ncbi:hypothetical protein CI109_105914 [Kwoniella shandongensis]|uniref:Uncharacterized protein n=1 Tax=Kwoniella shandongensis TaxID=1734106 RepID=A0A5M6BQ41_9TREE|nr:uncharacterized protein CI109_006656 [Kwoniella shandongensis]KAA5525016.1 hypothetical protein CI109_006656 [Kwoniella shandongensis]
MPIHPAPIILGTLAVIGSGYAFKKFIYDPHLAPLIEALLAQHSLSSPHRHNEADRQVPIPVPASSSGSTTARQHHHTHLRRRSHARRSSSEYELNESLLHHRHQRRVSHDHDHDHDHALGHGEIEEAEAEAEGEAAWGRTSSYELDGSTLKSSPPKKAFHRHMNSVTSPDHTKLRRSSSETRTHVPLIDLGDDHARPESPQDAEVREVIFNYAPTPLHHRSGANTPSRPSSVSLNPFLALAAATPEFGASPYTTSMTLPEQSPVQDQIHLAAPSTTFSFLSLSQQSSPEPVNDSLQSLSVSFGTAAELVEHPSTGTREDDVISLPETTTSGYEDAESYSPISRALSPLPPTRTASPTPVPMLAQQGGSLDSATVGDLGMSYVMPTSGRRGPMSVVSMTESDVEDGWRSESEWEAVGSEVGGGR